MTASPHKGQLGDAIRAFIAQHLEAPDAASTLAPPWSLDRVVAWLDDNGGPALLLNRRRLVEQLDHPRAETWRELMEAIARRAIRPMRGWRTWRPGWRSIWRICPVWSRCRT